jgi:hypothetical protein
MNKDTLEIILDVLTTPLDMYGREIEDVEDGMVQVDNPQILERLRSLDRDYEQDLRKLRAQFLEAVLIEGCPADEAMLTFWLEISRLMVKYLKLGEPLELKYDRAFMERRMKRVRESFLEVPKEYALPPEVLDIMFGLIDSYIDYNNGSTGDVDSQA